MNRGMRKAKTPKQVKQERKASKGVATAVAQIIGIGLVAGTALVIGTDRVMKKIFKEKDPEISCDKEEACPEACSEACLADDSEDVCEPECEED